MLGVTTRLLPGTTTGVVDTGVDTTAGTTVAQVVPPATARGVMAAVATVCWITAGNIFTLEAYLL